jgi:TRAP transporter 4TM/12TM fusion protein
MHFLIPLFVLCFLLLVFFWTPTTSASWAILVGIVVAAGNNVARTAYIFPRWKAKGIEGADPAYQHYTQNPDGFAWRRTRSELLDTLETGARNMAGVAAACACCGIIIGVVTLTGLGLKMANFIVYLAGGKLFLTLLYSVIACIILGMGLPTTATYIVMAAMTAPAIITLSENMALGIPIVAVHLFVFYYGIVADDTPPVGLCAYAAAGIAGSDPIKTGWKSFRLDLAAFTLPFMFIYNPKLIMHNTNWTELIYIIPVSILGMFCWSVFIQGHWVVRTYLWERIAFLGLAFLLVNPSGMVVAGVHISPHIAKAVAIAAMALFYFRHRSRKTEAAAAVTPSVTV